MPVFIRRATAVAVLISMAAVLAGCGDNEADKRTAFILFLQTRIIDKDGVHVPSLTNEEKSSLGPYIDHYMVIGNFNREMDRILTGPYKIAQSNAPRSMQELIVRRADVKAMADAMASAGNDARKLLADTDAKRAALKQPDDLKPVYAKAYERDVTAPAQAFLTTIPVAVEQLTATFQLADYLESHRATVRLNGSSIQAADDKTQANINKLQGTVNAQNERLKDARDHLRIVMEGR